MPEITREEVRAWLHSTSRLSSTDARMARAALAALEDAERLDWIEARHGISISERTEDGGWRSVRMAYAADDGSMLMVVQELPPLRAAIDRARG